MRKIQKTMGELSRLTILFLTQAKDNNSIMIGQFADVDDGVPVTPLGSGLLKI